MRPQVFMGIHVCSLAKQIQSSFDKSLHCHEILVRMQIPKVLSAGMPLLLLFFFCLPRKLFMSYLMIFKCAFVICLCYLTVDICYVSRTGEVVSLLLRNLETIWHFMDASSPKASIKFTFLKRTCNANKVLHVPINPLGPIVHVLYFSSDNVFSIRCIYTRAVNPPHLQILRIDGKGMINDVIMTTAHDIICEKNCTKKMLLELQHLT